MALVVAGKVAAAFAVLDQSILAAVGAQIGAALHKADLSRTLAQRQVELERLSVRMIQQHEDQRRRIGRELHDETAQVFSALKLQLGTLREVASDALAPRFDRLLELVDVGSRTIRNVAEDLRPALLDDLGLVPALRALIADFQEWSGVPVVFTIADGDLPRVGPAAELAMFRGVQEGLANVARHAQAAGVRVGLARREGRICLTIDDDGVGMPPAELNRPSGRPGRSGLFGMQERIEALGGSVVLSPRVPSGLSLTIDLPEVP
jgi:signal transduction histidine kinase